MQPNSSLKFDKKNEIFTLNKTIKVVWEAGESVYEVYVYINSKKKISIECFRIDLFYPCFIILYFLSVIYFLYYSYFLKFPKKTIQFFSNLFALVVIFA